MILEECARFIRAMFDPATMIPGEFGVDGSADAAVRTIGYATNLTPETVASAAAHGVELIVTHHDAWEFVYGMKAACTEALKRNGIAHIFAHLPLDAAEFGTAASLARVLGASVSGRFALYEGFECGVYCTLNEPLEFTSFVARMEQACHEKVRSWRNSSPLVRSFGVVPGAGQDTSYVRQCAEHGCDLYVTGERNLFTVQYAAQAEINLVVGSHTFTEIFGVEQLVNRLVAEHPGLKAVGLNESHVESST